ncbi:MAG: GNAT family N-acetyltransferase [Chloroherpetonaceae bacterium]|nr:GNAT family N-acetyltransferase [Chloroherpetonaceae bacterium]MCS7210576.1 GNAT family N-acetyltransferase [Chloroherpetonaceae bacterium]MDW8019013.1 GNAT family N-acetyltransferase [Chloroherpetonaceae bacterium]MDW8465598.1 GNAT family N-acetyltransferase [Chloroherpetonaceae bacterium]
MLKIRFATEQDVPLILTFIKALAEYERLSSEVQATEARLRQTLFGSPPAAETLLAFEGDEPVGFALFFHNYSTFLGQRGLYLEDLFVKPEHRGKGYGKALLVRLAQIAKERNCGRMEWSVLDWNTPSIEFYKKLGAVPMSDWTTFRLTSEAIARLAELE